VISFGNIISFAAAWFLILPNFGLFVGHGYNILATRKYMKDSRIILLNWQDLYECYIASRSLAYRWSLPFETNDVATVGLWESRYFMSISENCRFKVFVAVKMKSLLIWFRPPRDYLVSVNGVAAISDLFTEMWQTWGWCEVRSRTFQNTCYVSLSLGKTNKDSFDAETISMGEQFPKILWILRCLMNSFCSVALLIRLHAFKELVFNYYFT